MLDHALQKEQKVGGAKPSMHSLRRACAESCMTQGTEGGRSKPDHAQPEGMQGLEHAWRQGQEGRGVDGVMPEPHLKASVGVILHFNIVELEAILLGLHKVTRR